MSEYAELQAAVDNAAYAYIAAVKGSEYADMVDYNELDKWLQSQTGIPNPISGSWAV